MEHTPPADALNHVEPEPAVASDLFGDRILVARQFASDLIEHGETLGLIGPLELGRLWTRHLLNCALVAPLLRPGRVGDVGSGAGLPGLVLAIGRPDAQFVLIEPMERRVAWLNEEAARLGLDNVEVLRARSEDVPRGLGLDQVTARAVAGLSKLLPLTAPLVKHGGELLLMKGANAAKEIEAAAKAIAKHGLRDVEVLELGAAELGETTRVIRATVS